MEVNSLELPGALAPSPPVFQPQAIAAVAPSADLPSDADIEGLFAGLGDRYSVITTKLLSSAKVSDLGSMGAKLSEMVSTAKGIDPKHAKHGFLEGLAAKFHSERENLLGHFKSVEAKVDELRAVIDKMAAHQRLFEEEEISVGPLSLGGEVVGEAPDGAPISVGPLRLPDAPIRVGPLQFEPEPPITVAPLALPEAPPPQPIPVVPLALPEIKAKGPQPQPVPVAPLALPEVGRAKVDSLSLAAPKPPAPPAGPIEVAVIGEHPAVAPAVKRAAELFPELMAKLGHHVRAHLGAVLPLTFEKISSFGDEVLARGAELVSDMKRVEESIHEVRVEDTVRRMLHDADPNNRPTGLKGLLAGPHRFGLAAAQAQLSAMERTLNDKLRPIDLKIEELGRIHESLGAHAAAVAVLRGMPDHASSEQLLARKGGSVDTSLKEVQIAMAQARALQQMAQDCILRCKEVRLNLLPSYGIR